MTRGRESRRDFLKLSTAVLAVLPVEASARGSGRTGTPAPGQHADPAAGLARGPEIEDIRGQMGPVTQLSDGTFLAVYPEGRIDVQWDQLNIPQRMWGRFSPDGLGGWSEPKLLFNFPPGPGSAADGITSGSALPLTTRDGAVHM